MNKRMESTPQSIDCIICNGNNEDAITLDDNYDHGLRMVLCKDCGLGYLSPRWSETKYAEFYKDKYDDDYRSEIKEDQEFVAAITVPLIQRLDKLQMFPQKTEKILDVGCGAGNMLLSLKNKFPKAELFGIEPSDNAVQVLEKRKINVISRDVNDDWSQKHSKSFDLIIMRHVLEHFLDPKAVLEKILKTLNDDGILYIGVPNNLKPVHHTRKKWFRVVHTYYFNRYSLRNLLELSGFEVLHIADEDGLVKGEVYAMVRRPIKELNPTIKITSEHYTIQKKVYIDKMKDEKKLVYRLKLMLRGMLGK